MMTSERRTPVVIPVMMTALALGGSLVSGCGSKRDQPFSQQVTPDLAVTTLEQPDIEIVATSVQLQGVILLGCTLSGRHPLPPAVTGLIGVVREQHVSRGRDLDALVQVKNAPVPKQLGAQHALWLDELGSADPARWSDAVLAFHRTSQTASLRLFRDAADRSPDPDVRAFAARQLRGIMSTLELAERLAGAP